ncbi:AmmeMemoRadiSam system radical SAM enzyme [candidate division KSB1 bacterium]|nr:AmmeMemoRadiSam system radical SAM enzyme [candidate division KSB1 bacterium]RQW07137.1 MAG: AmmeMemoRadiSam system radical SAM enzyme [candidate division KSB1 bacterium]
MNKWSRREFLACAKVGGCAALCLSHVASAQTDTKSLVEARYYEKLANRKIQCKLCPRECLIDDLERGYCGVRENIGGTYYTLVYGKPCTAHIDPIEKKPLFHFLPGTTAFSLATVGCNVMCKFCQNWEISQATPEQVKSFDLSPYDVARIAEERGCASIAYTYSEPVIFTEYMYDSALQGNELNVRSVMISNGYINPQPMHDLCAVLSGVKIDLKAYTERFYKELVAGELRPVLDTLVLLRKENMWTEIVYLVIPGQNDDPGELKDLCTWILNELGPDTPLHFSRFHPQYRLKNLPSTPIKTLTMAREIARERGLNYVYTGNVPGDPGENTYCPNCGEIVIRRIGFSVVDRSIKEGACAACGTKIAGVWS